MQKLVGGQVVVTRGISPAAYEHVARGLLYEEEERFEEAAAELERALVFDGDAPELLAHLAEIYVELDRLSDADARAQASLAIAATPEGWLADAAVREARRDREVATEALRRAAHLATQPGLDREVGERAHLALADALLGALDLEGARDTLRAWIRVEANTRQARLELAAVSWALGLAADAETSLREVLEADPDVPDAQVTLGQLLAAQGRTAEAKRTLRAAMDRAEAPEQIAEGYLRWLVARGESKEAAGVLDGFMSDEEGDAPAVRAALERAAGRPERGRALAEKALKRPGDDAGRLALMAAACAEDMNDARGAALLYQTVSKTAAEAVEARIRLAALWRRDRRWDAAARALGEAAKLAEGKADAGEDVAIAQALLDEDRGRADAAVERLRQAEKARASGRLALARAGIEERRGDTDAALAIAAQNLAQDPLDAASLNFAGFVAADHDRDLRVALARVRVAFALEPGSAGVLDSIGWTYFKLGQLDDAGSFLEQASHIEPGDPEILGHLGDLYAKRAEPKRAAAAYRQALALSPDDKLKKALKTRLSNLDGRAPGGP